MDDGHGLAGWKQAAISSPPELRRSFPEPVWYARADGALVMLCRAVRSDPWLYASVSHDDGASWSLLARTNLPSATSRMAAGNLPDARVYCIWNPSQTAGRNPLVIALSQDGVVFDRAWVLRGEPTQVRYPGISKVDGWQYPAAVVWREALWVAYSVNKEDLVISRVPLTALQ